MPMVGKMSSNLRTTEFLKMQMEDSDIFNIFYLPNDFVGKNFPEKILSNIQRISTQANLDILLKNQESEKWR